MDADRARFDGIARLLSREGLERLQSAHVCVVGVGGVGSWAVEALARSGVGTLTLVDLDDICLTNVNRQLPALEDTVGRPKVQVLAERIRLINPACVVHAVAEFLTDANLHRLLARPCTAILDAIDHAGHKCLLIAHCRERQQFVVSCGAAGGRRDPTALRSRDLADVSHDRLLAEVRRRLRKEHHGPPPGTPFGVPCIFSTEPPVFPTPDGGVCARRAPDPGATDLRLACETGFGTAAFVTGAFGLAAAGVVVRHIAAAG